MTINEFLQSLSPSGKNSFENLVGDLLGALMGFRFYAARSGDQGGRDGRTVGAFGGEIVFECKRYSNETTLKDRELLGELAQAQQRLPELDMWILATSRNVTDQNLEPLQKYGKQHGIDILPLESLQDGTGNLDLLLGTFPEVVSQFANVDQLSELAASMSEAARRPGALDELTQLRRKLQQPDAGWPSWRESSHKEWNRVVSHKAAARSRLGQPLDVSSGDGIPRAAAEAALDNWWSNSYSKMFAMTGEEGDGKSWSVAQWLTNQILESNGDFPPIVFIPSCDAGSAESLETLVIANLARLLPSAEWKTKIHRWLKYRDADGKDPVAVVVLDGLNERHTVGYWRKVIETSFDEPWVGKIRLICTVRRQYWDEHFAKLSSIPEIKFKLESFNDNELQAALTRHDLKISDFPDELRPVLRKPRYFNRATKYRQQIAESGDFTLARLYFEDWRDRYDRSHREMSEDDFNNFLKRIAEKHRDGVTQLASSDVESFIGFDADSRNAFRELATGGVLERRGAHWRVSEERLPMALGLLLSDELAIAAADVDLRELIAKWLEPHTGADLAALIIEFAVLASVAQGAPSKRVALLLQAWIDTQNPQSRAGDPIERRLTSYVPQCLDAYIQLAWSVWSDARENSWAQEVLIRGFCFWVQNSQPVVQGIIPVLGEWLALIPLDGPAMFRRTPNMRASRKPDTRVQTLWPDAQANREYDFDGYALRVIDDDGWLRLSHAAFVIISFIEDRRTLVPAFVRYSIAKAIHESADGQNEFCWAVRGSKTDLYPLFEPHIQRLLDDKRSISQRACSQLLRKIGTETAWQALRAIDEEALYPKFDWGEDQNKHPVESRIQCTIQDLEEYVAQEDFKPWPFIHAAEPFAAEPNMNLPQQTRKRLQPILEQLEAQPLWQGMWKSGEDHLFEKAEIVLSRVDPGAIANVIRHVIQGAPARQVEPLFSLTHRLAKYDLLLDAETRTILEMTRQSGLVNRGPNDSKGMHGEYFIFSRVLPLWAGADQLERLRARPADAIDWIDFEHSYKGPVTTDLREAKTPRDWFRTLYYLSVLGEDQLDDDALQSAYETSDSLTRGSLYRYLLSANVSKKRFFQFISDWSWDPVMHHMEQTFGSLLLIKLLQDIPSSDSWKRVDPTLRATAILKSERSEQDWAEYSSWFRETIAALRVPVPEDDVPAFEITHYPQENGRPGRISLALQPTTSVRFVAPESHWGGRQPEGNLLAAFTEEPEAIRERTKAQYEKLRELNDKAAHNGNYWTQRCFPTDAIEAMLVHTPDIIEGSLHSLDDQLAFSISFTAFSYYSALAEVLFATSGREGDAIALNRMLRSSGYGIRIVDADTRIRQLDFDSFAVRKTPETQSFWEEELASCSSDFDLLELALKIRHAPTGDSSEWLNELIDRQLLTGSAFDQARAVILRGFLDAEPEAQWLNEVTEDDDSWYRCVLRAAQQRVKLERDTRYWFRKFCRVQNMDEAWAAFRLFLTLVDRRFWLWCYDEFDILSGDDPRRRFFESNRDEIRKACRENEENLSKSFVGCKVADQMSPWKS